MLISIMKRISLTVKYLLYFILLIFALFIMMGIFYNGLHWWHKRDQRQFQAKLAREIQHGNKLIPLDTLTEKRWDVVCRNPGYSDHQRTEPSWELYFQIIEPHKIAVYTFPVEHYGPGCTPHQKDCNEQKYYATDSWCEEFSDAALLNQDGQLLLVNKRNAYDSQ